MLRAPLFVTNQNLYDKRIRGVSRERCHAPAGPEEERKTGNETQHENTVTKEGGLSNRKVGKRRRHARRQTHHTPPHLYEGRGVSRFKRGKTGATTKPQGEPPQEGVRPDAPPRARRNLNHVPQHTLQGKKGVPHFKGKNGGTAKPTGEPPQKIT